MSDRGQGTFWTTAVVLLAFGVAMGYLEAAVVVYLRAALDQDYYPDLIYTPPSAEYVEAQLRQAKAMGLNCLRLHIKIGDPRYYAAADRLGLLIWTELPNWQRLTPAAAERARATLEGMLARDWNHPSIIFWTIINECWGLDLTLTWRESGGPRVSAPARQGFGTRLIDRLLRHELDGEATRSFEPEGLVFVARLRLTNTSRFDNDFGT